VKYFFIPVFKPKQNIINLLEDKHKIAYSFITFLFLGCIYTITVYIGYQKGFGAVQEPFLKIPAEDYYFWQMFYQIPLFIIIAILFAGTVRLTSLIFKGEGTFEDIFAICCVSLTFPMFLLMWVPESILVFFFDDQRLTPLGGFKIYPMWFDYLRLLAGIIWPIVVIIRGIIISEKLHWLSSTIITLIASIPLTAFMIIFVR
jgi:hypothetical protein